MARNTRFSRRKIVALTGAAVTTGLVGCMGSEEGSNSDGSEEAEEESTTGDEYVDEVDGQVELIYGETASLSNGVEVIAMVLRCLMSSAANSRKRTTSSPCYTSNQ